MHGTEWVQEGSTAIEYGGVLQAPPSRSGAEPRSSATLYHFEVMNLFDLAVFPDDLILSFDFY